MNKIFTLALLILFLAARSQTPEDSVKLKKWFTLHFQQTFVEQYHPGFATSTGSGDKSLSSLAESCLSSTTTMYVGARLWKNAEIYFNPEVAAGSGFSGATGVAGFTNGETFRVGSPAPSIYIARFFFRQTINIGKEWFFREEDQNKIPIMLPVERVVITFGKFSISDIFDGNVTSHDPKTSLLNWSMMDAGAWDYPSNTRGYTYALSIKVQKKQFNLRFCTAVASQWSNGMVTSGFVATPADWLKAHGELLELTVPIKKRNTIKLTFWANHAPMGSFRQATQSLLNDTSAANREVVGPTTSLNDGSSHLVSPAMDSLRGHSKQPYYGKVGIVLNWEMNLRNDNSEKNMVFIRGSWNDGKRESWMYTEIDESLCAGAFFTADFMKRPDDVFRVAASVNGVSKDHADYLRAGGYGFIIGDGLGNYPKGIKPEFIVEAQYNLRYKFLTLTPDYQFIVNPAYNPGRGPVNVVGLRAHFEI